MAQTLVESKGADTAIRKLTLAQTGCMSQGYWKEMKNVVFGHLPLANCWALFVVYAADRNILEKKQK